MAQDNLPNSGREALPALSVVVPVRNEAGNIGPLVAEIAAALQGRAFEIVYVNDGSTDTTEQELRGLMAERPYLRQIRHEESCGQSAAVRTGVALAHAPVVVTLDGDGQNDPVYSRARCRAGGRRAAGRTHCRPAGRPQSDGI